MVSISFLSSLLCCLQCSKQQSRVYTETLSASQEFEADLAERFQELHTEATSSFLNLSWLSSAVGMLLSTQDSVQGVVPSLMQTPLSAGDIKQIQQYMDDSVKLLDACRLLMELMSGVDGYVKGVQLAMGYLCCKQGSRSETGRALQATKALISAEHVRANQGSMTGRVHVRRPHHRLAACRSMLRRMGDKLLAPVDEHPGQCEDAPTCSSSALPPALYGGQMGTLFVFKLLAAALPSPNPGRSELGLRLHISGRHLWSVPLLSLQDKVNRELSKRSVTLLPDLDIIDISVQQIIEMLTQLLERRASHNAQSQAIRGELSRLAYTTRQRAHELQTFMATLQEQIQSLSRSLVDTRLALLDSLARTGLHV